MKMSSNNLSAMAMIAVMLFLVPGCSDDSPVSSELCIEFDSAQAPTPGTVTSRLGDDSECEVVVVELVVTGVNDVFGIATTIEYDTDAATYRTRSAIGSVLGNDLLIDIEDDPLGTLTVGVTRIATTGVDVAGTEVLIKLFFDVYSFDAASGPLSIEDNCLLDSGTPPEPINGVTCSGGTLAVR
jgi:hypothetical protein